MIGVGIFFGTLAGLYWFTSYEAAGSMMLFFTVLLGIIPGTYLLYWSRRMKPRPEDRNDARMDEGEGAIGSFPDSSIWPLVMGMGAASIALGFVYGIWAMLAGGFLLVALLIGITLESRRGGHV